MKPVILVVDDEPEAQQAIERGLRVKYSHQFEILIAETGQTALERLRQLKLRGESVALLLVDLHMPDMNGVEFLQQAIPLFPDAKRILTASYADGDAAIRAINTAQVDYYLVKSWEPLEECLSPVLVDLLSDWLVDYRPHFEGIRVIGHQWSALSHATKDFLARNQIPYRWLDIETSEEARVLAEHTDLDTSLLPVVLFPDGTHLAQPTNAQLAAKAGLKTQASRPYYDLIIVGGGPAGLAAAVYGASEGLRTALIEREAPGGQAGTSSRIENYLGFPAGLSGADLARRAVEQADRFGVEIISPQEVTGLKLQDAYRLVTLSDGSEVSCHALLIATGVSYRKLDVPGIEKLTGAGVYYGAAMTEALSCQDQDVYIVGGANSAGQAAMYFSRFAKRVTLLVRGDSLAKDMSEYLITEIGLTSNIEVQVNSSVVEARGETSLEAITIANSKTGEVKTVPAKALFIFIGAMPRTDWLAGIVERDEQGFILTGPALLSGGQRPVGWTLDRDPFLLESGVPGVFVAGDVRSGSVKRVASGVGEGSIAVQLIHHYLSGVK